MSKWSPKPSISCQNHAKLPLFPFSFSKLAFLGQSGGEAAALFAVNPHFCYKLPTSRQSQLVPFFFVLVAWKKSSPQASSEIVE